jgi:protein gp37
VTGHPFENFDLILRHERLKQPLAWKRPRTIFVNSMSDLFHEEVPRDFIDQVFDTMERADWHIFQVLTKRSTLLSRYLKSRYGAGKAPSHIWCGVSVEDAQAKSASLIFALLRRRSGSFPSSRFSGIWDGSIWPVLIG